MKRLFLIYYGSNIQNDYQLFIEFRTYMEETAPQYLDIIDSSVFGAIRGNDGNNALNGTNVSDVIYGGGGNDRITGGNGNDLLFGGTGNDTISGGSGNDMLYGDSGNDTLDGGTGNDARVVEVFVHRRLYRTYSLYLSLYLQVF